MEDTQNLPEYMGSKAKADWSFVAKPIENDEIAKKTNNHDHRIQYYNDHADEYDDDLLNVHGLQASRYSAITLHKFLDGNEDAKIIDIGCGTGLVGEELKKLGSYNNIDGLDPAEKLLEIAIEKKRISHGIHQYFTKDSGLPSNKYDGLVSCGSFTPGHMHPEVVFEMCRIVKPGGIIVIGFRTGVLERDLVLAELPSYLKRLVDESLCDKLEESICPKYFSGLPGSTYAFRKCGNAN